METIRCGDAGCPASHCRSCGGHLAIHRGSVGLCQPCEEIAGANVAGINRVLDRVTVAADRDRDTQARRWAVRRWLTGQGLRE